MPGCFVRTKGHWPATRLEARDQWVAWLACTLGLLVGFQVWAQPRRPVPDGRVVLVFCQVKPSETKSLAELLCRHACRGTVFLALEPEDSSEVNGHPSGPAMPPRDLPGVELGLQLEQRDSGEDPSNLASRIQAARSWFRAHKLGQFRTIAWPQSGFSTGLLQALAKCEVCWGVRGVAPEGNTQLGTGPPFQPGYDHPLLIPASVQVTRSWTVEQFENQLQRARGGNILVVRLLRPATSWTDPLVQSWVASLLEALVSHGCRTLAVRDLGHLVHPGSAPRDPWGIIRYRQSGSPRLWQRDQRFQGEKLFRSVQWLENMHVYHGYGMSEMEAVTGWEAPMVARALQSAGLLDRLPFPPLGESFRILPYPGGRHPRIGFRDGAIDPWPHTKCSVFLPWDPSSFVVIDLPEAVWVQREGQAELLFLAHTHLPTIWSRQGEKVTVRPWRRERSGGWRTSLDLPNGVRVTSRIWPEKGYVAMELAINNPTDQTLRGLRVQQCVLLGQARGFDEQTNANKRFAVPWAGCCDRTGSRWILVRWERAQRCWGNPPCPCLHSDPQLPDCPPGQTRRLRGQLWLVDREQGSATLPPDLPPGFLSR